MLASGELATSSSILCALFITLPVWCIVGQWSAEACLTFQRNRRLHQSDRLQDMKDIIYSEPNLCCVLPELSFGTSRWSSESSGGISVSAKGGGWVGRGEMNTSFDAVTLALMKLSENKSSVEPEESWRAHHSWEEGKRKEVTAEGSIPHFTHCASARAILKDSPFLFWLTPLFQAVQCFLLNHRLPGSSSASPCPT